MQDQDKSKQELIEELAEMRRRVAAMESVDTDRKQAEEALRLSEGRYRALAESTRDIIFILDGQGTLLYANQAAARCIGIPAGDIVGKRQVDLFPPEMARSQIDKIGRTVATGEVIEYDDLFHFGPAEVWLRIHLIPIRDEAGQITSIMGVCHDITGRKLAEKELAKSKAMLQAAIDCLPFNFFAIGLDGRYVLQNAVSKAQQRADVMGKLPEEVCPNEHDLAIWLDNNRRAFAGEKVEGEVILSLGGEERFYFNIIAPIRDSEELYGILGVNIDITERKRAEEALQKAHDELERRVKERTAELAKANENLDIFRKFVEASGEGFGMSDFDGRIAYANSTLSRLFGEDKPEDVIGKNVFAYYPEEYMQRRKKEMIPALLRNGYWRSEQTVVPRRGKSISTRQSTFLIRDEDGSPLRIAVVVTDITERKRAEEALAKEHRNLKHLLQSSDHERQLIAYEIHDDLAQHLAGALMQLQTFAHLKDKNLEDAAKAFDAWLTMLQQGHFEARRLIAGVRPPILDEAGVAEAVSHLIHEVSREKGPKIHYHSRVEFDRLDPTLENAIYRIAQEALTNACQHSKSLRVSVSLLQREDRLRIEIRDWGVGFDPQAVPESHFGLEGIRQRARLLGGKCGIRSKMGKGTRIVVELPVVLRDEEV